jgi:plastocyanin
MHTPRGSNNRLKAAGVNTENENRLFDSQNNAKGGYNVGVGFGAGAGTDDAAGAIQYYTGTDLYIEWTNQHACGDFVAGNQDDQTKGSKIRECEIVLQYMCEAQGRNITFFEPLQIRNGFSEDTPPTNKDDPFTGQHEPRSFYTSCQTRFRNKGIFTADRRLTGETAIYTRQNNNGNRRGYECPEERDYYPYWHPTPWRDIAVLTNNKARCPYYQRESQNKMNKGWCSHQIMNNQQDCSQVSGVSDDIRTLLDLRSKFTNQIAWYMVMMSKLRVTNSPKLAPFTVQAWNDTKTWLNGTDGLGIKSIDQQLPDDLGAEGAWNTGGAWNIDPPVCDYNNWTRSNHLGNGLNDAKGPYPYTYKWSIPQSIVTMNGGQPARCVLRVRYNMSSADYENWGTFSWGNWDETVIKHNPKVNNPVGPLQLTINTNQVGRTFQDRSHIFYVVPRANGNCGTNPRFQCNIDTAGIKYPDGYTLPAGSVAGSRIHNLNVRGKRGNIVQAYPAVEYDYTPNPLTITAGDLVHFQWTGSNTNPNNYAGQGTDQTDRSNIMQITDLRDNLPTVAKQVTMWSTVDEGTPSAARQQSLYKFFALLDQKNSLLNDASAYINYPPVKFSKNGTYHFMCSRNNNFSNRSQKGSLIIQNKA